MNLNTLISTMCIAAACALNPSFNIEAMCAEADYQNHGHFVKDNICYRVIGTKKTWTEANEFCSETPGGGLPGGKLAWFNYSKKRARETIRAICNPDTGIERNLSPYDKGQGYWIGAKQLPKVENGVEQEIDEPNGDWHWAGFNGRPKEFCGNHMSLFYKFKKPRDPNKQADNKNWRSGWEPAWENCATLECGRKKLFDFPCDLDRVKQFGLCMYEMGY